MQYHLLKSDTFKKCGKFEYLREFNVFSNLTLSNKIKKNLYIH